MLENQICDHACYNHECGYDNNACNGECYEWMLGNGICEDQCNTADRNYDMWDCTCSHGCSPDMQFNDICEEDCYKFECGRENRLNCTNEFVECGRECIYDYDYNYCNTNCLVKNCEYNHFGNCDNRVKTHAFYYQNILRNQNASVDIYRKCLKNESKNMIDGRTRYCTLSKLGDGVCDLECNSEECAYDLGDCSQNCHSNCRLCYEPHNYKKCLECKEGFYLLYTACYEVCPYGFEPDVLDSINICSPIPIFSREVSMNLFVIQESKPSDSIETGADYDPFRSITDAFAHIRAEAVMITLLNYDNSYHYLKPVNRERYLAADILDRDDRPLDFGGIVLLYHLQIGPAMCSDMIYPECYNNTNAVLQWNSLYSIVLDITFKVKVERVDIYGYNSITLDPCPLSEYYQYCTYCQSTRFDYDNYIQINDHGTEITWKYAEEEDCERYKDSTLFNIYSNGSLHLSSLKIYDWRAGFKSIIYNERGTINLVDVKFENIILNTEQISAVILSSDCPGNSYRCGEIKLYECEVSLLNNGFEYDPDKYFSGFLYARGLFKFELSHSIFRYNLSYKGENIFTGSAYINSLIYLENFLLAHISDTHFDSNLTGNLIFLDMKAPYEQGYDKTLVNYHENLNHIQIQNLTFTHNSGSLIGILLENELPNINIESISSKDNISSSSFIDITLNTYRSTWESDRTKTRLLEDIFTSITLYRRTATLSNISFVRSYVAGFILQCVKIGHLKISDLSIENSIENENPEYLYMESLVYSHFREYPRSYILNQYKYTDLQYLYQTQSSLSLNLITGLQIQNITLKENYSNRSGVGIEIREPTSYLMVSHLFIYSNKVGGEKAAIGIAVYDYDLSFTISYIAAQNNENNNTISYGIVFIQAKSSCQSCRVDIYDSNFEDNSIAYGVPFIGIISSLYLTRAKFVGNISLYGYGSALYLDTRGQGQYRIDILDSCFIRNQVFHGKGGAFVINNRQSPADSLELHIINSDFISNISNLDSSAIFISSSVRLSTDSNIRNCTFTANESVDKGSIYLKYNSGQLTIENCRFIENKGSSGIILYFDIYEDKTQQFSNNCNLTLKNCTISNNYSSKNRGTLIHKPISGFYSRFESFSCIFTNNNGSAVYLDYGEWIDHNSEFKYNNLNETALITLSNNANAELFSVIIIENTGINGAGVIELSDSSSVRIRQAEIKRNRSSSSGAVITMEKNSVIKVEDTSISENYSSIKGSVIYSLWCISPNSYINNTQIFRNSCGDEGTIYLWNSYLNIINSEIYQNTNFNTTPGIILYYSTLHLSESSIYNQSGTHGAAIHAMTRSDIKIYRSHFKNLDAVHGGFLYALGSEIEIIDSIVEDTSAECGGAIFAQYKTQIFLINVQFINSISTQIGSIIRAQEADIYIERSTFLNFEKSALDVNELESLIILQSNFNNGSGDYGGAISCKTCKEITISDSTFENISANLGGAVYATTEKAILVSSIFQITSTKFMNNKALRGGALYTDNINITVQDSYFYNNSAYATYLHQSTYGEGGATYNQCSDFEDCTFYFANNTFSYNHADRNGGAISWRHFLPDDINNTYTNNTASYGTNISTYPISIHMIGVDDITTPKYNSKLVTYINLGFLEDVSPGHQGVPFIIALRDIYNNISPTDSQSTGEIFSYNSSITLSGKTKVSAIDGLFIFEDYSISAQPGSTIDIFFVTNGIDTSNFKFRTGHINNLGLIIVALRDCLRGEKRTEDKCVKCPKNTYSLNPADKECEECPSNAICYGEYYLVPKPGYWRVDINSEKIFECPRKKSCIGSPGYPNIVYSGLCESGYQGNLCQGCAKGYSRGDMNICKECPTRLENIIKLTFSLIGVLLALILVILTTMKSAYKPKSIQSIYIKIFINYIQLIGIISEYDLSWPRFVSNLLSIQSNASNVSKHILSVDCLLNDEGYTDEPSDNYFFKLRMIFYLPFALSIVSFSCWSMVAFYKGKLKYLKEELVSTNIILLFLIHPSLVTQMFSAFSCIELEDGEYWLVNDMQIKCWSEKHTYYAINIALPGLIIWCITIPAICMFILIRNKRFLNEVPMRLRFGFLYNGYSSRYYYWEFIILYKKMIIIFLKDYLGNISQSIQALTAISVLLLSLYLQSHHNPYNDNDLNEIELRSKLVAVITIYCGLFYLSGDINSILEIILFCLILLSNLYFFILFLKKLLVSIEYLINKLPCLKSRLGISVEQLQSSNTLDLTSSKYLTTTNYSKERFDSEVLSEENEQEHELDIETLKDMHELYILISRKKNLQSAINRTLDRSTLYEIKE